MSPLDRRLRLPLPLRSTNGPLLESFGQDVRFAIRTLGRSPGYTAIVVLALAVGIGATTAVYSVVDGVLLRPLVYEDANRVLVVGSAHEQSGGPYPPSYPDWRDWRARSDAFADIAFTRGDVTLLHGPDGIQRVLSGFVSDGFFDVLGTQPALGRVFTPEEERGIGGRVAVLGHGLWASRFGADRAIVGKTIRLDDATYTIVGVMPRGFRYPDFAQLWTPLAPRRATDQALERRAWRVDNRVIGRLAPGITVAQATEEIRRIAAQLAAEHAETNEGWSVAMTPIRDTVIGNARSLLRILLGAAAAVLLIACFNVTNLSLVRATARVRELAVRASLGAGRARLARQLLVESLVLALVGGACGVLLAWWGVEILVSAAPGILPRLDEVRVDTRVLAVSSLVVLATALVFGTAPAVRATKLDLSSALRGASAGGGSGGGSAARRLRSALVVTQTALALMLLVGAGLLLRSFYNVLAVDAGFREEGLVTLRVLPPPQRYSTAEHLVALYDQLRERIAALPGVQAVALINHLPFAATGIPTEIMADGRARPDSSAPTAMFRLVSDEYFATMDTRVMAGRALGIEDMTETSDAIVVNETLARTQWPNVSALGRRLTVFKQAVGRADYREPIEGRIVGVVQDVRPFGPEETPAPEVFLPFPRNPWPSAYLAIRTIGEASTLVAPVRRAALAVEPNLPMDDLLTMEQRLDELIAQRRMSVLLLGSLATVALLLAAIGIYGVIAYAVTQRTREIGVRLALGAEPGSVLRLVLRDGLMLGALGVGIGAAGAVAATRLLSGMLYEVTPTDPAVLVGLSALLLAVAAGASLVPARRAALVDPVLALRSD